MTFPNRDSSRLPETSARRVFTQRLSAPWPWLTGIGVAVLVIVLVALFPGEAKLAAPLSGARGPHPTAADAAPSAPAEPIAKPSPLVPKRARRALAK